MAFPGFLPGKTIAILIKSIPIIAIAPFLKFISGKGIGPNIAISVLICFLPALMNAVRGFRALKPQLLKLMDVLPAAKIQTFRRVRNCSAMPHLFSELKISVTMCGPGAIAGEWIGADKGIGCMLLQGMFGFNTPRVVATFLTAPPIAIPGFANVSWLETRVIRWNPGAAF